jgi:hypothetical protein
MKNKPKSIAELKEEGHQIIVSVMAMCPLYRTKDAEELSERILQYGWGMYAAGGREAMESMDKIMEKHNNQQQEKQ